MGNINNETLYPNETTVNRTDFIIGSNQDGITKTFKLDALQSLLDVDGYTRAQVQTLISNSALKVNVNYKITDAGSGDETIIVRAASVNTLFSICYNLSDTSLLYQYNISTDTLSQFSGAVLDEDDFASDSAVLAPSQQSTKAYLESRFLPEELANGTTITFEKDKTSSEIWTSATITLSQTNFTSGRVIRLAHQATSEPTIEYGGISVLGAIKGEYTETDPATINIITFISRVIDGTNSVEIIYEDYLSDATPLYPANNLSDISSAATARQNLGLEIGVDVQAFGNYQNNTQIFTAGEVVNDGDWCYLKSDGKMWKADASAAATAAGKIAMANATILADASGEFLVGGEYTTSGLTAGATYFLSESTGAITNIAPTTSAAIIRVVGYAESTTKLHINISNDYAELT